MVVSALAIKIRTTGGPDVMRLEPVGVGPPGPGEVLLRQTAIGVNFIDIYHRSGLYPTGELPSGLGREAVGVVEAVGPKVTQFEPGDRVGYAGGPIGSYSTWRVMDAELLVPLPDELSGEVAASALLKGMTAEFLIHRAFPVESGMTVLFHAAAGGVGHIACQWLRHIGARVIGTVSSESKASFARAHGCHEVIQYGREEDLVSQVHTLTRGRGVSVVFDGVGRDTLHASLASLKRRGTLVLFGNASGRPQALDVLELSRHGSLYLTRPTLSDYTTTSAELRASATALFDALTSGKIEVEVGCRWALADAKKAHRALEARETVGSTVLKP